MNQPKGSAVIPANRLDLSYHYDLVKIAYPCRGKKRMSVWACEPLVSLAVTAWRALYSIKENGIRYFVLRLNGQHLKGK